MAVTVTTHTNKQTVKQTKSDVAGRALQVGIDRWSSLAFKGAGTETACSQ